MAVEGALQEGGAPGGQAQGALPRLADKLHVGRGIAGKPGGATDGRRLGVLHAIRRNNRKRHQRTLRGERSSATGVLPWGAAGRATLHGATEVRTAACAHGGLGKPNEPGSGPGGFERLHPERVYNPNASSGISIALRSCAAMTAAFMATSGKMLRTKNSAV